MQEEHGTQYTYLKCLGSSINNENAMIIITFKNYKSKIKLLDIDVDPRKFSNEKLSSKLLQELTKLLEVHSFESIIQLDNRVSAIFEDLIPKPKSEKKNKNKLKWHGAECDNYSSRKAQEPSYRESGGYINHGLWIPKAEPRRPR